MNKQPGFTLIELSIVLVIIGLIVGGVLVGRELIHAAELRSDISQLEKYKTAINTFKIKYNCIPGDCVNATALFLAPVNNGNGDGLIDGLIADGDGSGNTMDFRWTAGGEEISEANNQLAAAKLIPLAQFDRSDFTNGVPGKGWLKLSCASCGMMAMAYNGVNYVRIGTGGFINAASWPWIWFRPYGNVYLPEDAYAIDSKIDDGKPLTGNARDWFDFNAQSGSRGGCETTSDGAVTYDNQYNITHAAVGGWGFGTIEGGPAICTITVQGGF